MADRRSDGRSDGAGQGGAGSGSPAGARPSARPAGAERAAGGLAEGPRARERLADAGPADGSLSRGRSAEGELIDGGPVDRLGRPLRDLRVSVTDRCNFRCVYCMPKAVFDNHRFLSKSELLSFEEIERVVRGAAALGVTKVRLTGGEPLLRRDLEALVEKVRGVAGIRDVSMTTNASLLTPETRARAARGRAAARQRQPRRARRRDLPPRQRRRRPGARGARRHRGGRRGGFRVGQDQHGRQEGPERGRHPADGPPLPRQRADPALHRVHGRRQQQRLGPVQRHHERRDRRAHRCRAADPAARRELPRRGRQALGVPRRRWRDRHHLVGLRPVLRGLQPRPALRHGQHLHLPVSARRPATTCAPALRDAPAGRDDDAVRDALARIWTHRGDRYSETRTRVSVLRPKVEMSFIGG